MSFRYPQEVPGHAVAGLAEAPHRRAIDVAAAIQQAPEDGNTTVILTISVLVIVTVSLAAFVLAPRIREERVRFDATPDGPLPFGLSMAWLAVRTDDPMHVARVLDLAVAEVANWDTGIGTAYDERLGEQHVYVTPPLSGWVFVVGLALPQPLGRGFVDKCTPMLLDLAGAFPEAQYFLSYPPLDCFAWARVSGGKLVRAFAVGDDGVIWNKGRASKEERALGLRLTEVRGGRGRRGGPEPVIPVYPTQSHVLHLAGCWSLDPSALAAGDATAGSGLSAGMICRIPVRWRPERMRRAG